MNPLLVAFLSSLARFALAYVAGLLTRHKVIDENEAVQYVEAASSWAAVAFLSAIPLVWSYLRNRTHERQLEVAIEAPAGTTVAEVKAEVAQRPGGVLGL